MLFWVFGYGSLVWNRRFEVDERVIGFIKDYQRVFDLEAPQSTLLELAPWKKRKELIAGLLPIAFVEGR
ncbi:hypothetical protein ACS0TY_002772 [Phlomoides rotata]